MIEIRKNVSGHRVTRNDFYPGEIRDMVLETLSEVLGTMEKLTRRRDVLEDILSSNKYEQLGEKRKQRVKELLKGYKNLTGAMRQELQDLGFEISDGGKHYKVTYRGDSRYVMTLGKTPSDNRSGANSASQIIKKVY